MTAGKQKNTPVIVMKKKQFVLYANETGPQKSPQEACSAGLRVMRN